MNRITRRRERGAISATDLSQEVSTRVLKSLALAETKRVARIHTAPVRSLAIDPVQNRYLLSTGSDMSIQLFDLETSERVSGGPHQIAPLSHVAAGSGHTRLVSAVEWYPVDSGMFSTSSFDHTLRVWDTATMAEACQFDLESRIYCHRMSPTGAHALIAAANESAYVRLCDLRMASAVQQLFAHQGGGGTAVAWSPHQPYALATGGADGMLKLWDIRQSGSCIATFGQSPQFSQTESKDMDSVMAAHAGSIKSIQFSKLANAIVSSGSDKHARVWRADADGLSSSALLAEFLVESNSPEEGTVEPSLTSADDGTVMSEAIFYPSGNGTISAIELTTGRCIAVLHGHFAPVTCVEWRTRHMELYSGGADSNILVWCPPAAEILSDEQVASRADSWSDSEGN
ncbi:hypothetical protein IW140_006163 [Coemansia sp. RSA 1813]|nr:hypothetical protein LPJ74_005828 [Coemansia sp. RSA 1843]KAJ2215133.1 hypothetical protein EV179_002501 [Coemansia sp. RSA 487]KAJ2563291.1 hypothetical protein IW140_006163 [Coemansia sp. RSA 1813]